MTSEEKAYAKQYCLGYSPRKNHPHRAEQGTDGACEICGSRNPDSMIHEQPHVLDEEYYE